VTPKLQGICLLVLVSEAGEEEYGQGFDSFRGPHRGRYFRGFRGPAPRMGRGGDRWHDVTTRGGRLLAPRFGSRFERPGRFEGQQRFNGPLRFNGARGDGPPRFGGPGGNRFNVPRFEGRPPFDASPMFRRGGPPVQLEGPFRGSRVMGPRFRGPVPTVQPLLSQVWYDNDEMEYEEEMENEEEMQDEDFDITGSGAPPPLFDHGRPPWMVNNQMENEENVHKGILDDSSKADSVAVCESTTAAVLTENTNSSGGSAGGEKRVRKSRWSSAPADSAEQQSSTQSEDSSAQPADSNTAPADSAENAETVKTDTV